LSRYLEARDLLAATGDESAAWAIAQTDSGLLPGVTREQWLDFARRNIARA
jgi:branched-subunit amino acid aminotransferase/4-amino-4-deoxychorismate lyase